VRDGGNPSLLACFFEDPGKEIVGVDLLKVMQQA
jgi:hypothetical protein